VEGPLSAFIVLTRRVIPRLLIMKTLFCGSPFAEYGVLGIRDGFPPDRETLRCFLSGLEELARKTASSLILFKDFPEKGRLSWIR